MAGLRTILTVSNSEAIAIAVQQGTGLGFVSQMVYQPFTNLHPAFWDFANQPESRAMRALHETTQQAVHA